MVAIDRMSASDLDMTGYSGTPLPRKLGIKSGMVVVLINAPRNYRKLLQPLPPDVKFSRRADRAAQFVHLFVTKRSDLARQIFIWRKRMADEGMLWVSWPKKSSGVATDVSEGAIREIALPLGLVDVKVCAVDETWSGLKLMIRREQRKSKQPSPVAPARSSSPSGRGLR